jgi:hypothetical protein
MEETWRFPAESAGERADDSNNQGVVKKGIRTPSSDFHGRIRNSNVTIGVLGISGKD